MSTHNIRFYGETMKIIPNDPQISSLSVPLCGHSSTVQSSAFLDYLSLGCTATRGKGGAKALYLHRKLPLQQREWPDKCKTAGWHKLVYLHLWLCPIMSAQAHKSNDMFSCTRVVPKYCDKFFIFETKQAISAKLADLLAISIGHLVSKFQENNYTNSDITSVISEQHTIDLRRCQREMHNLIEVEGFYPAEGCWRYISVVCFPQLIKYTWKKIQTMSKIKNPQSIINWTASSEFGTYRLCEQRRFRRACESAQSRQNLRCSLIQAVSQEEPSDRKPDPWPLWMTGHAQLQFVMTECSKTQIRLTGLNYLPHQT